MAKRRPEAAKKAPDAVPIRLKKHLVALGLARVDDYLAWCTRQGFPTHLDKSWAELEAERDAFDRARAQERDRKALARKPVRLLVSVARGEVDASEVSDARLSTLCEVIGKSDPLPDARASLCQLLEVVDRQADFLCDHATYGDRTYPYVSALVALNDRRGQWLRPLEEWAPRSYNRRRQFSSLARHLMVTYEVPEFMDSVWFRRQRGSYRHRDWFLLVGNGGNIRHARTPIALTKKMAHHFLLAPSHYTVEAALRWGQLRAQGADPRLCDAVVATRLGRSFEHEDFWETVLRFFVANPMLDRAQVGPIVDYLQHQRFEPLVVVIRPGVREERPPPQPGLSMRGRTPDALLRQVERWHHELGRSRRHGDLQWAPCGIRPFELVTGSKQQSQQKVWRIRELITSVELFQEGRLMKHCVGSYAASCHRGVCSIWAMEVQGPQGIEKRQTIEVSRDRVIVQCRGKSNVLPDPQDREMVRRWATQENLSIATYLGEAW